MDLPTVNNQVVFTAPGVARLESSALPALETGHLLVRTRSTLISPGTERAFFLGLPNTTQEYPQFAGYSSIGDIVATGPGVASDRIGISGASASCHAQYVIVDADACLPLPKTATSEVSSGGA